MNKGKYIVIEGPEGVGKTTQLQELARRLRASGLPVRTLREPDSQSDLTARAIRQLTQDPQYPMNTRTEVLLYNAARSQSLEVIKQSVEQGVICLVDRNYLTTLAIQYYGRGDVPDYDTISKIVSFAVGGVEPDLCVVLDAPVTVLRERLRDRSSGERFDNLDDAFLERVRAGYLWEAKHRAFPVVFATESREAVSESIWQLTSQALAVRDTTVASTTTAPASIKEIIDNKVASTAPHEPPLTLAAQEHAASAPDPEAPIDIPPKEERATPTDPLTSRAYLAEVVTSTDGDVYAFTGKIAPATVAAIMARSSRRGDDIRATILDEFAGQGSSDTHLIEQAITAYGDDSVRQLANVHMVVERASDLLAKKLEWGRLATYLEQPGRYTRYDQKDATGHYQYFIPQQLKPGVQKQYSDAMDTLFGLYAVIVERLTDYIRSTSPTPQQNQDATWRGTTHAQACDIARAVLPVAATSTVGIFASGQALESLISHLLSDALPEARSVGQELLKHARQVIPAFLEHTDKPEQGGAAATYRVATAQRVHQLAREYLSDAHTSADNQAVTLVDFWPRNELLLVPDMLYEYSDQSLEQLQTTVNAWPYDQKIALFKAYIGERLDRRHRPGRALEKAHYSWDLVCDYGTFRALQRHRIVEDLAWQALSPRHGYEMPGLIEKAGLSEQFEACFDVSLKLYSTLQQAGYQLEAQYAILLGHKMRWKVTYNAREAFHIHELRANMNAQAHPGYRQLVLQMHEKLAEVHPLLAESMRFVSVSDDPQQARRAAERYTQSKASPS